MWVDEMDMLQRKEYGLVRLTSKDFKLLGIKRTAKSIKSSEPCESCRQYPISYMGVLLNSKNVTVGKRRANLCKDCKANNSDNRKIPTEWAVHQC